MQLLIIFSWFYFKSIPERKFTEQWANCVHNPEEGWAHHTGFSLPPDQGPARRRAHRLGEQANLSFVRAREWRQRHLFSSGNILCRAARS